MNTLERKIYPSPPYADFPRGEFEERVERIKEYMREDLIDALVLWDEKNIRYFTGFYSAHWNLMSIQPAVCIIPLEEEPILILPSFFRGPAEGYTYVRDIRGQNNPHLVQNIEGFPVLVADTLKSIGCGKKRIGIESGWWGMRVPRPIHDIDRFRSELSEAQFVEAAMTIWRCRMIKSPAEVEAISVANKAVVEAHGELVAKFEMGMTERDVGVLIQKVLVEKAHQIDGLNLRCTSERYLMSDTPPFHEGVTICKGDRMTIEPFVMYKGYSGSCARTYQVGEITKAHERSVNIINKAQNAAFEIIKPGLKANVISLEMQRVFKGEGSVFQFDMVGHGIGLTGHEPPMLTDNQDMVLKEGMVLAIEVWKHDISGFVYATDQAESNIGPFGYEDLVVVTKDGCDLLPSFRKDILSLPH